MNAAIATLCVLALVGAALLSAAVAEEPATPVELGTVAWGRDFDEAVVTAKEDGKALLVLFQEVPG